MAEYFVPIFSINVIWSVFWGEFYITNKFSHAKCLSTTIIIPRAFECFCAYMDFIFRHSGTDLSHIIYKIHPKCNCIVITLNQCV